MSIYPRTIAVGFDGSDDAIFACEWAMATGRRLEAHLVLVHARGLLDRFERRDPRVLFGDVVSDLATRHAFDQTRLSWHVADGDACSVLLRCGEAPVFADLVIVGSRGRDEHAGMLIGSTSLQLAERSPIPVVIVPSTTSPYHEP